VSSPGKSLGGLRILTSFHLFLWTSKLPCNPPTRGEARAGAGKKGAEEGGEKDEKEEWRVQVALENIHFLPSYQDLEKVSKE